jgi:hypothetical protein
MYNSYKYTDIIINIVVLTIVVVKSLFENNGMD